MTDPVPSPPQEILDLLWPAERILWWGRSDPAGTAIHVVPDLVVSALWLAYALDAPVVSGLVEWALRATVKVGTAGFSLDALDGTMTVIRTLLGIAGLGLGLAGLYGVALWLASRSRDWHVVTDGRVASGTSGRLTVTYLRNVALVRSRAGRFGREVFIGLAGMKHAHAIVGVADADGAARAIDGAIRRLQGGEGSPDTFADPPAAAALS